MSEKMSSFQDKLIKVGVGLNENKYLGTIKDAFIALMPVTMIGSISVLWSNVIVNETTGIGAFFKPIMALSFINPMFNLINFATIGCISLWIAYLVGSMLSEKEGLDQRFGGILGVIGYVSTLSITTTVSTTTTVQGIFSSATGTNGLFSALIVSMVTIEIFKKLYNVKKLRIHLPEQVPPQISQSFAVMIPAFLDLLIIGVICLVLNLTTGLYLNDVIMTLIQKPLVHVGGSLPGMLLFQIIILALWSIGLHGDNMLSAIVSPIVTAMTLENMNNVSNGLPATNVFSTGFNRAFFATGGTGMVLGLTIAMLIRAKRPENRSIAKMSFIPNLFNIGEIDQFGFPIVMNPPLMIPFILAPLICGTFGYIMTKVGFCPVFAYDIPWTMPPVLIAFIATGGSWRAIVTQIIAIGLSVLIYLPFIPAHERAQEITQKQSEEQANQTE